MPGRAWMWSGIVALSVGTVAPTTTAAADPVARTPPISALATPAPSTGRWVTIVGRGFGHGVGMAQDGAYWMGRQGRSSAEILRHFYPGTALGTRSGDVRVPLGGAGAVTLILGEGGTVAGRRVAPGGSVTVRPADGELVATISAPPEPAAEQSVATGPALVMEPIAFRSQTPTAPGESPAPTPDAAPALQPPVAPPSVDPSAASVILPGIISDAPPPLEPAAVAPSPEAPVAPSPEAPAEPTASEAIEAASPSGSDSPPSGTPDTVRGDPLVVAATDDGTVTYAGRRYRGSFELRAQGGVRVVNELDVEQYLRGMGEVTDPRWPAAALQAQAIAARTYAFRTMASAGEVCPTQRCQVYIGVRAEYGAMDDAVAATRGKVVTYDKGKLAVTFYSASGGGTIATPQEAWGGLREFPYLQAGTYPTGDLKSWVVTMAIDEIGRRVGYGGNAARVEVTRVGPSGRAIELTVSGDGADLAIDGPRFDAALGLRSTLFTLQQSDAPEIAGLGDVEVLSPSDPARPSGDDGPLSEVSEVFAQTGFFESPRSSDEPVPSTVAAGSNASPASMDTDASPVDDVSTTPSPTSAPPAEDSSSARPAPTDIDRRQQSDVVFIGALAAIGASALAGARRLVRTRGRRLKSRR